MRRCPGLRARNAIHGSRFLTSAASSDLRATSFWPVDRASARRSMRRSIHISQRERMPSPSSLLALLLLLQQLQPLTRSVGLMPPISAASGRAVNPHLQYFSVWEAQLTGTAPNAVEQNCDQQRGWLNFLFTSSNATTIRAYHAAGLGPGLFHVRATFYCGGKLVVLCDDWEQRWQALLDTQITPLLDEGAIFGVFLGDEIVGGAGVGKDNKGPWNNLSAVVSKVRADLPSNTTLYYNEAATVIAQRGVYYYYPHVPTGLSWISLDMYANEGTAAGVKQVYSQRLYPIMGPSMKALLVPPAYGFSGVGDGCASNTANCADTICCRKSTPYGSNPPCSGNCSRAMLQWARFFYDWAREDQHIVGVAPYHWETRSGQPAAFEPGLSDLSVVLHAYKQIGAEIVSGRQADLPCLESVAVEAYLETAV